MSIYKNLNKRQKLLWAAAFGSAAVLLNGCQGEEPEEMEDPEPDPQSTAQRLWEEIWAEGNYQTPSLRGANIENNMTFDIERVVVWFLDTGMTPEQFIAKESKEEPTLLFGDMGAQDDLLEREGLMHLFVKSPEHTDVFPDGQTPEFFGSKKSGAEAAAAESKKDDGVRPADDYGDDKEAVSASASATMPSWYRFEEDSDITDDQDIFPFKPKEEDVIENLPIAEAADDAWVNEFWDLVVAELDEKLQAHVTHNPNSKAEYGFRLKHPPADVAPAANSKSTEDEQKTKDDDNDSTVASAEIAAESFSHSDIFAIGIGSSASIVINAGLYLNGGAAKTGDAGDGTKPKETETADAGDGTNEAAALPLIPQQVPIGGIAAYQGFVATLSAPAPDATGIPITFIHTWCEKDEAGEFAEECQEDGLYPQRLTNGSYEFLAGDAEAETEAYATDLRSVILEDPHVSTAAPASEAGKQALSDAIQAWINGHSLADQQFAEDQFNKFFDEANPTYIEPAVDANGDQTVSQYAIIVPGLDFPATAFFDDEEIFGSIESWKRPGLMTFVLDVPLTPGGSATLPPTEREWFEMRGDLTGIPDTSDVVNVHSQFDALVDLILKEGAIAARLDQGSNITIAEGIDESNITLFGHSQGGAVVTSYGLHGDKVFKRAVNVQGFYPNESLPGVDLQDPITIDPTEFDSAQYTWNDIPFDFISSAEDQVITPEQSNLTTLIIGAGFSGASTGEPLISDFTPLEPTPDDHVGIGNPASENLLEQIEFILNEIAPPVNEVAE